MKNNFHEIKNSINFNIDESSSINLIDLNECDEDFKIDFNVNSNIELYIDITILNFLKFKKTINVNVILNHHNSFCKINLNCLGLDNSITNLSVNGICLNSINGYIDITIDGIIDSDNAKIIGSPNFNFSTNKVDAHHSLSIGGVNPTQLEFLQSRRITSKDAKYLLVTSKLFKCLNNLNDDIKQSYQNKILSYWEA